MTRYAQASTTEPQVCVVVCTRNRPASLARTLESLSAQRFADFEVVVVDQSSDGNTRRIVEGLSGEDPRFGYLHLETPGLSRAYNVGIAASRSPLLAFTDDDCTVPVDWLDSIVAAFAAQPDVLLMYGQVLLPPEVDLRGESGGVIPTLRITERRVLGRNRPFELFGMGANFAARRRVFELVGPFDEVLGGGGPLESSQDFDFMYRVFRSGYGTLLEPTVMVHHYGFRSSAEWPATMRSYGIGVGGFFAKHVRMGDPRAARLLMKWLLLALFRATRQALAIESTRTQGVFARSMVVGMRRSLTFAIDRRFGVYRSR
jgi:glycosyltransferase involved in cell wall biosynthesis